jgi:hypothetical protein
MKVAMLDPRLILDYVDVVIGDYVYELQFAVEEDSLTGEPQLIGLDSTNENGPKEDDPKEGEKPNGGAPVEKIDLDGKVTETQAPGNGNGVPPFADGQQQAPNGAAQLEVAEEATISKSKPVKPQNKPRAVLSQSGGATEGSGAWTATLLPPQIDSGTQIKKI